MTSPPPTISTHPALFLHGLTLEGGWRVTGRATTVKGQPAGGHQSVGYFVERADGHPGFLKAIDLSGIIQARNVMRALQEVTEQFNFEVSLLEHCSDMRLSRVVHAIDHGEHRIPGALIPVPYIVFDRADGDVRDHLEATTVDDVWLLRCIHHVAVGLHQLHTARFAHNDVKPANVLVFEALGSKIGDLGTAVDASGTSPHGGKAFAGSWDCAPPEVPYLAEQVDAWQHGRRCDLYMLGGLITFLFTHQHFNTFLKRELPEELLPLFWGGDFTGPFEEALPHLLAAFDRAAREVEVALRPRLHPSVAGEVTRSIRELCHPDPARRGHPRNLSGLNPLGLERYISLYDRLVMKAGLARKRGSRP
ncbi:protein kinase [Deinococcus sp. YIM 77859]|uniref:protein kinase domain-containing protein n=1 Tax=Deinococcus sp. YIM 77859 TaxID=1540221 RepID=UPI000557742C|nr:protein kinase [Deinococcus sp. YIM 77859]